eukprot:gene16261-17905_t
MVISTNLQEKLKTLHSEVSEVALKNVISDADFYLAKFEVLRSEETMGELIVKYIKDVSCMLSFIASFREKNMELHLQALQELIPLLFAFNHHNYSRYLTHSHIVLSNMKEEDPDAYDDLSIYGPGISLSGERFSSIPGDLVTEVAGSRVPCLQYLRDKPCSTANHFFLGNLGTEGTNEDEIEVITVEKSAPISKQKKKNKSTESARKKEVAKFDWSDDLVEDLITEWQQHTVLFDVSHPEYHLKDKRRIAIEKVIGQLEERGVDPVPSWEETNRKMNSLRGYFVAERNKVHQSKASGAGTNDAYKVRWQFYESLQFLADNINPRRTESNVASQGQVDRGTENRTEYAYPVQNTPSSKSTKKTEAKMTNELLETAINVLKRQRPAAVSEKVEERTANKVFSELVWKMLQEIPDGVKKDMVKIDIQRQLLHAKHSSLQTQQQATQQLMNLDDGRGTPSPSMDSIRRTNTRASSISNEFEREPYSPLF